VSWTCVQGNKTSKARKRHRCIVCDSLIESGETQVTRVGIQSGEGFLTMHMHPECEEFSTDWTDDDWESYMPGSCTRAEILGAKRIPATAIQ
jgi:hypothetical protein